MGCAAASRAEGETDTLEELEFHWGSAYHFAVIDGVCTAWRRDGRGSTLADPLPEGLRLHIRADYMASPVPRDTPVSAPRRGVFDVDEDRALEALRLAWGGAYDIGHEYGKWVASRRGDGGRTFDGDTPDALTRAIQADWAREATR